MIKSLQKKFIKTAMIAISALILAILIGINIFNLITQNNQIHSNMELLSRFDGGKNSPMPDGEIAPEGFIPGSRIKDDFPDDDIDDTNDIDIDDNEELIKDFRNGRMPERTDEDRFMSLTYFIVRYNSEDELVYTDTSRIASVSDEYARLVAEEVNENGNDSGRIGTYIYQITASEKGKTITFLDTSSERAAIIRIIIVSLGVGIIAWLIMLGFVILLSKKAIRPIAENIEKQKQFVTNAGHELKTPLAIIQANCDAMELFNGENKWSSNIKSQVTRMNELTKNLLTLARMDESAGNMLMEELDLTEMVSENIKTFSGPFSLKGVALEKDIMENVHFKGDRAQMSQLFSLLFDNAVKYVNESGKARVSLSKRDRKTVFMIQNTCSELPAAPPGKLFDRFYRSDESHSQKTGGHGIGLSVVSSIVSNHGGRVQAEYIQPDIVRFTVTL